MEKEKQNNEIVLKQLPIIQHRMIEVGKNVQKRIEDLNLENQVVTIDNVKSMKSLRSELNKELEDFENQRKKIKKAIAEPYNEFEDVYKVQITERYSTAVETLKNKIDFVEDEIKTEKKEVVKSYFLELCNNENIDFLKFEDLKIDIKLSVSEKKYKEQVSEFVSKVLDDLSLIKTTEFEAEILTEYKKSLNCSQAITIVNERKEHEKKEQARIKAELVNNRKKDLQKLGFVYKTITDSYEYNDEIFISETDINELSKEDFTAKYEVFKVEINELKEKENINNNNTEKRVEKASIAPKLTTPKVEKPKEELKKASFEVTATMEKLRALGAYMKENGIIYKNIKK